MLSFALYILYLENDRNSLIKVRKSKKNRFNSSLKCRYRDCVNLNTSKRAASLWLHEKSIESNCLVNTFKESTKIIKNKT